MVTVSVELAPGATLEEESEHWMPADCGAEQARETGFVSPFCGFTEIVPVAEPPARSGPKDEGAPSQKPGVVFKMTPMVVEVRRSAPRSASLSPFKSAVVGEPVNDPLTVPKLVGNAPFPRPPIKINEVVTPRLVNVDC